MKYMTYLIYVVLWMGFCIGGCAYLVFWRGESGWWFVLAIYLAAGGYNPRRWYGSE